MTDSSHPNRRQRRSAIQRARRNEKPDIFEIRKVRLDRQRDARYRTEDQRERLRLRIRYSDSEAEGHNPTQYAKEHTVDAEESMVFAVSLTLGWWLWRLLREVL